MDAVRAEERERCVARVDALVSELEASGGEVLTGHRVASLADLPPARAVLLDVTPRQLVALAGDRLSSSTRQHADRFRYGSGVFKVDWALDGPVPWTAEGPRRAATIHLGGTLDEIAAGGPKWLRGGTRTGRTSCSSSTRHGTPHGRPPARPRLGRIATYRPAPPWT